MKNARIDNFKSEFSLFSDKNYFYFQKFSDIPKTMFQKTFKIMILIYNISSLFSGCRAVEKIGIKSRIVGDGMTRGPIIRFPSVDTAANAMQWVKKSGNFALLKTSFDSTSRFARLQRISTHIAGRNLFLRFVAETGDAMGMNMISKGK